MKVSKNLKKNGSNIDGGSHAVGQFNGTGHGTWSWGRPSQQPS